jgi:hypothetical protein
MNPPRPRLLRDLPLAALTFEGPDAASFLHGQLSTDVLKMEVGAAELSSYNSPKGRMLATPFLWRRGASEFVAYVPADIAEPLRKRISMFVLRAKVHVARRTDRTFAGLVGAGARDALAQSPHDVIPLPDGRVLVDAGGAIDADADESPADHWDWLGVHAGVPQVMLATQDLFVPQSANLDLIGGVDFRKGCYPGQEIVARMQYLGRQKERMFAFHADAPPPAPAARVHAAEGAVGTVVYAAPAPAGGSDFLAIVPFAALDAGELRLEDGAPLAQVPLPYPVPPPSAPQRVKL